MASVAGRARSKSRHDRDRAPPTYQCLVQRQSPCQGTNDTVTDVVTVACRHLFFLFVSIQLFKLFAHYLPIDYSAQHANNLLKTHTNVGRSGRLVPRNVPMHGDQTAVDSEPERCY